VVYKSPPWHPTLDAFDPSTSFVSRDMELLQQWGINVIRLGIMWPGVEPERGHYNWTYLQVMRQLVEKAADHGIYTLLDFHQDALS
jgi:endoglycosylceramidase